MEKQGLIKRVKDMPRKNMVRVTLTKKGEETYLRTMPRLTMHETMSVLTEEERKQLWNSLQKIRERALKLAGVGRELPMPPLWFQY